MEDEKTLLKWIKKHKTALIVISATAIGTFLVIGKREAIKGLFKAIKPTITSNTVEFDPPTENKIIPAISHNIWGNLTGNKLTATELGNNVLCSAQSINKRIVAAGLAVKLPCSDYALTDAGHMVGEKTWKVTRAGHSFSNIEWDEKVLEIIFSPEELLEIANRKRIAREILSRPAV